MIANGFRLYREENGKLHLDQIVDGFVYELVPAEEDGKRKLGYYDADFKWVAPDEPR